MDKIKRYIECYIPTETCNFRCHYCYITKRRAFNNKLLKLSHEPKVIAKALSKERLGGTCLINLCAGGETLLSEEIIDLMKILLEEGHYLMVVTNGSLTKRFEQIAKFPKELLNHLIFKFSFHYLELKRLNLLETYAKNVKMMKDAGASIVVEVTPNDELEEYKEEIKKFSMENFGALPHITIARDDIDNIPALTKHEFDEYINIWKEFNSTMLDFKSTIFGKKRNEFCYAGEWSIYLNIETGEITQCYCGVPIGNIYKNIEKPIKFLPIGCNCSLPHCYNGHAFLTLGDIPELKSPTYSEIRDRRSSDGTNWLTQDMRNFMNTKLEESNEEYSIKNKNKINRINKRRIRYNNLKKQLRKISKR